MHKYNNSYPRSSGPSESQIRFNKRPRYAANNSPRFPPPNQIPYNYPQNRNNLSPSSGLYQHPQYDQSLRNYYGYGSHLPKPPQSNFERQKKQSNLPRRMSTSSASPSVASKAAAKTNTKKTLPPSSPTTPKSANTAQSKQQQNSTKTVAENMPDQTFAYNNYFYPYYNMDATNLTTTTPYGMNYNMCQYMWQTPPPNMLSQPPLPKNSPPTKLPPLPSGDMPPSPKQNPPAQLSSQPSKSSSLTTKCKEKGNAKVSKPVVTIKAKRKAISARYNAFKNWSQANAELALKAEEDISQSQYKDTVLVLRFPDPEINREIIKNYNPAIESVYFQLNFAPRYCFVHLKPGSDVEQTIEALSKVPFGLGFLKAEIRQQNNQTRSSKPCEIDPCTLYVGNLPTTIACTVLKEHFPGANRIDIGFAQRMKYTRYAFIRYENVQQAIEAYKRMSHVEIDGRCLLIRFRRIGTQKDDTENAEDLPTYEGTIDDLSIPVTNTTSLVTGAAEKEDAIQFSENQTHITDNIAHVENTTQPDTETNTISTKTSNESNDSSNLAEIAHLNTNTDVDNISNHEVITSPPNNEINQEPNNEKNQHNEVETITNNSNISSEKHQLPLTSSDETSVNTNSTNSTPLIVQNIKQDPDIDPDDKVVGDETIPSRFDKSDQRIKQEKELVTDFEFFAPADNQLAGKTRNIIMNETATDDCDETIDSGNSLSEFLRTCHRDDPPNDNDDDDVTPASKKARRLKTFLEKEIKNEPAEINKNLLHTTQESIVETPTLKQEFNTMNEDVNDKSVDDICNLDILPEDNFLESILLDKAKKVPSRIETSSSSNTKSNLKRHNPNTRKDALPKLVENERHLNNNTNKASNKKQSSHKHKSAARNNSRTQNLLTDNDDLVPPSAFFLRSDVENSATVTTNQMYDDEFFATETLKLSENTTTANAEVKQEPFGLTTDLHSKETNTAHHKRTSQEKLSHRQHQELYKTKSTEISKSLKTTRKSANFSNNLNKQSICSDDIDDLVPENNYLLSRQPSSQVDLTGKISTLEIKLEKEFDDLFSTPFKKTYHERLSDKSTDADRKQPKKNNNAFTKVCGDKINLNVNSSEDSSENTAADTLTAKTSTQNFLEKSPVSNNGITEYDDISDKDDDLIIISENFPSITNASVTPSSAERNFLGQSELLTFKHVSAATDHHVKALYSTVHESSRKLHHDDLDKLFQQLDSDSDNEL